MPDQIVTNPVPAVSAPTPPTGPTTLAGLASILVGLVIAILSLFDVVPTEQDVQQLGVIVGGLLALGSFVVTAISRTKQANNLAKLAQAERVAAVRAENPRMIAGPGGLQAGDAVAASSTPNVAIRYAPENVQRRGVEFAGRWVDDDEVVDAEVHDEPEPALLGAPVDHALEVPGGGPRPDDLAEAARTARAWASGDDDGMRTEGTP